MPENVREQNEQDLFRLHYDNEDVILKVEQFQKYHFRLFFKDESIEVWPVRKKFYARWMSGSRTYQNVSEIMKEYNNRPKVK